MTLHEAFDESKRLHDRATGVFPGGVSHNVRYFDPHPRYIERADGPHLWDVDGNRYLDFWMNHIVSVLGHTYPEVVDAVQEQAANGLHYGAVNELTLELGEAVTAYVPSADRVRFCASGTEATMDAVRMARAATGRDVVLKAEGGWHGGNSDLAHEIHTPFDVPATAGLPAGITDAVDTFRANDEASVLDRLEAHPEDVAALIVEPVMLSGGGVRLEDDFLAFLREETADRGIILIFDEVVTGFRMSPGSYQARVGVHPDVTTLGKCLGGGLPVGAIAGTADLFERCHPEWNVAAGPRVLAGGGTFTANPMTAVAGLTSLEIIETEPVYEYTEGQAARVRETLEEIYADVGIDGRVLGESSLFMSHFEPTEPLTHVEAVETATNRDALEAFHRRLLDRGYYFLPGHMGSVSYQTTEEQLDAFLDDAADVARALRSEGVL